MTTTCCPKREQPAPPPATRTWPARLTAWWLRRGQSWRESSRLHAERRALNGLDDRTLHDLGLAERRLGGDLPGSWRDLPGAWRDPRNVL